MRRSSLAREATIASQLAIRGRSQPGFTIIELVVVIVIVGVLAATALPRFVDLTGDARRASHTATGAAFRAGVNAVHTKWIAAGSPGAQRDFLPITSATGSGALSVNVNGWPADLRGVSLTTNSHADCVDVWRAVLQTGGPGVSATAATEDYQAVHRSGRCTYTRQDDPSFTILYDSNTGEVSISG